MKSNFLLDVRTSNGTHRHFVVFANGANCGTLVMRKEEFYDFVDALQEGQALEYIDLEISLPLSPSPTAHRPAEKGECKL